MIDLNDLYLFAQVIEHGGFAAAGRALDMPKSTLSRRIASLEASLSTRLLQRSTRHIALTDAGQVFHRHCLAIVLEARAASESVEELQAEPRGTIRLSCPIPLLQSNIGRLVSEFMVKRPHVRFDIEATNRRVDVIAEGFDLALRVRPPPLEDSDLVMRQLATAQNMLVVAPDLLRRLGPVLSADDLARYPSCSMRHSTGFVWELMSPDGKKHRVRYEPRLVVDEMMSLMQAAIAGVGVVYLPQYMVEPAIERRELVEVLPHWTKSDAILHAVMPSRRGMTNAVRAFVDALAEAYSPEACEAIRNQR
ncbi:LysR family transcriptional regulator [soil metagenome]